MKKNYLTKKQIDNYKRDGAIVVQGVFKPWINLLRLGFNKVLKKPGIHSRENINLSGEGRFFEDYCNWQRILEFKNCIEKSPAAQIVAEATRSKSIRIFHEHIFLKESGTIKPTPWHQDMPYYCVDGNDTGSFWIPLDPVNKKNTLQLILGSHKWPKLVKPTKWLDNKSWYNNNSEFTSMPPIENIKKKKMIFELKIGDAILFNFKTLHSSPGNITKNSRRAFSMRFMGDDVRYLKRDGKTSPPFDGINLKTGENMRNDWFPVVWNR
ncbi:phytanoyl-CoA dioxygenase family protein [Candidatus Pelagibacter sp.]|nr:phytanoyl-CoA dioxygenase family protein [Candidatus Pelagibacter sp.]